MRLGWDGLGIHLSRSKRWLLRMAYAGVTLRRKLAEPVTLGVRVLLVRDSQVLLVRHTYRDGWYLPGGGVKRRETLEDAIRREAREEVGATVDDLRLMGVYSNFVEAKSDHVVVFVSEGFTLTPVQSSEIAELRFVPLSGLPAGVSPGSARRIAEYLERVDAAARRW
ncbi:MAG: NUDIX domain-containing protein [Anaerolinea sp.]|nr:NUDIX domain-containing protein [Anaerolinea sp.]